MAGWSTVARLPFAPLRAVDELHASVVGGRNFLTLAFYFLLASFLYCLYAAHWAWVRLPSGRFLAGFGVLISAVLISTFVYVLISDMLSDAGRGRRLIFPLLLSVFAVSGTFSLVTAVVFEAGVLGLWKVKRAVAVALGVVVLWQAVVETVNLRRLYEMAWWRAALSEAIARVVGLAMALGFVGFMSGVTRPWKQWRTIVWVFGLG